MEPAPDYSAFQEKPTDEKFAALGVLVQRQTEAEAMVARREAELKAAQEALRKIKEQEIPEFMEQQLGLEELTLRDGTKIKIDEAVRAGITKERSREALKWLRDPKGGDAPALIKSILKVDFGRGEDEKMQKALATLRAQDLVVEQVEGVHAQTLGAWVREKLAAGKLPDVALELLGVHRQKFAKITRRD